jgi:hypothetical protein
VFANVYLPDGVHKFKTDRKRRRTPAGREVRGPRQEGPSRTRCPGVVPIVPLENNPTMLGGGQSDLKKVIPLQDAINKLATDMIVASEYAGFRQRWATGIEIPTDPETGQPLDREKWLSAVSRMWAVPRTRREVRRVRRHALNNYVNAIEMLVQHLARRPRRRRTTCSARS